MVIGHGAIERIARNRLPSGLPHLPVLVVDGPKVPQTRILFDRRDQLLHIVAAPRNGYLLRLLAPPSRCCAGVVAKQSLRLVERVEFKIIVVVVFIIHCLFVFKSEFAEYTINVL